MARAEIYIEDAEPGDGQVGAALRFVFGSKFEPDSAAHQLCLMIKGHLDRMAHDGALRAIAEEDEQEQLPLIV